MTDHTEELLPCPHCGAEPLLQEHPAHSHSLQIGDFKMPDYPGSWTVECCACGCGMISESKAALLANWNRRATPADHQRIAALEAENERLRATPAQEVRQEAVAWRHTLHMELDQKVVVVSESVHQPFGVRGENFDDAYSVTTEPLYTTPQPGPDVRALVEALEDIANDYAERFDMDSPSTNPGMKIVVENARAALAKYHQDT